MRIAYLFGSLNRGGAEKIVLDVLKNTEISQFNPISIYRKGGNILNEYNDTGVPLFKLAPRSRFDFLYILRLRKLLKKENVSIVHAQQSVDALFAYMACLFLPIKVVLTMHGFQIKRKFLMKLSTRLIIRRIDLLIFVSKFQQKYFIDKFSLGPNHKNKVIYNSVSLPAINEEEMDTLRKELNIPASRLLLCSVGSFSSGRDQLTICRFLKLLKDAKTDFHFIFVGGKNMKEPWWYEECVSFCHDNQLNDHVQFLGVRTDVPGILVQSDAFIYASRHDTFGIAVIEAIASGIPVFINNWDVMLEISDNGKRAFIYETENPKDLFDRFVEYISSKESYGSIISENSRWAKEKYSTVTYLTELNKTYNNL